MGKDKKTLLGERIELLERVAGKLEYRGIGPASDAEKLRVFAHDLKEIEKKTAEFIEELRKLCSK